jgi:hypothetical protein
LFEAHDASLVDRAGVRGELARSFFSSSFLVQIAEGLAARRAGVGGGSRVGGRGCVGVEGVVVAIGGRGALPVWISGARVRVLLCPRPPWATRGRVLGGGSFCGVRHGGCVLMHAMRMVGERSGRWGLYGKGNTMRAAIVQTKARTAQESGPISGIRAYIAGEGVGCKRIMEISTCRASAAGLLAGSESRSGGWYDGMQARAAVFVSGDQKQDSGGLKGGRASRERDNCSGKWGAGGFFV